MTLKKTGLDEPQLATDSSGSFLTIILISCSPGQAACQNLWSTPCGFRFHPAGAVTKINDLIFVVLAGWQHLCPGWLTLSAVCHSWRSPLPISQIALILRSLPPLAHPHCGARWSHPQGRRRSLHPIRVRTCKAVGKCVERIPHILRLGPGGRTRCWVPGREGRGARGNRLPTQQLTPPLISISSYSHKPNCLTFQQGSHVNRAFLVASSKSASFCLEGEVGSGEDVANLSCSIPKSEI